jgi:hypothetical protein
MNPATLRQKSFPFYLFLITCYLLAAPLPAQNGAGAEITKFGAWHLLKECVLW